MSKTTPPPWHLRYKAVYNVGLQFCGISDKLLLETCNNHSYMCLSSPISMYTCRYHSTEAKHDRSTTVHNIHAFSLSMRHQATDCCQLTNKPVRSVVGLCWDSAEQVSTSWTRLVQQAYTTGTSCSTGDLSTLRLLYISPMFGMQQGATVQPLKKEKVLAPFCQAEMCT